MIRRIIDGLRRRWARLANLGWRVHCPCCGRSARGFLPFLGVEPAIPDVECPWCGSHHRHRLLARYLESSELPLGGRRLLYVAPGPALAGWIAALPAPPQVVTCDLERRDVDFAADLTSLGLASESFDAILAVHVLEHVADDAAALRELHRCLRPGGWAILQVPLNPERPLTYEDPSIVDPAERERHFGQRDHVRLYGLDYRERLEAAGFEVRVDSFAAELSERDRRRFGIDPREAIYRCRRNAISA